MESAKARQLPVRKVKEVSNAEMVAFVSKGKLDIFRIYEATYIKGINQCYNSVLCSVSFVNLPYDLVCPIHHRYNVSSKL